MNKVSITLPATIFLRNVGGVPVNLDTAAIPAEVWARIAEGGAKVMLTNAFNGGGKDVPEAERLAQMNKRIDAWKRGEYVVVERGDNGLTLIWDEYVREQVALRECTVKVIEKERAERVAAVFGDEAKNSVSNFLDATALLIARENELGDEAAPDIRGQIEAKYAALAAESAKKAAAVAEKVTVTGLDLSAFKKAK